MEHLKGKPAIIYGRFSSHAQKTSISRQRQLDEAHAFIQRNGLQLLSEGIWFDSGVSGYKGKNRAEGELGKLLNLLADKKIPEGTVLIVESVDRLSRETPFDAVDLIRELVNASITIITLHDQQTYDKKLLTTDPSKMFLLIAGMQRAHSEAEARSKRSKASWAYKKKMLQEGEVPKMKHPYWIDKKGEVDGPKAQIMRDIFTWYTEEIISLQAIAVRLNEKGIASPGGKTWRTSQISRFIHDPRVLGLVEAVEVYTPIVSRESYGKAQRLIESKRGKGRVAKAWSSALRGVITCDGCGGALQAFSSGRDSKTMYCRKWRDGSCKTSGGMNYKLALLFAVWAATDKIAHTEAVRDAGAKTAIDYTPEINALNRQAENLADAIAKTKNNDKLIIRLDQIEGERTELVKKQQEEQEKTKGDIFEEITEWVYNRLPEETNAALQGEDVAASVELNRRLQESGIKVTWDGRHLRSGEHKAYRNKGGKVLYIENQGVIKQTEGGTTWLGGDWWYQANLQITHRAT